MGKKPTKTASWRTLMRRAEDVNSTAEAKRLRSRAAAMRREERAQAKKGPPSAGKVRKVARKLRVKPSKADVAEAQKLANGMAKQMLRNAVNTAMEGKREAGYMPPSDAIPNGTNSRSTPDANMSTESTLMTHARAIVTEARTKKVDPINAIMTRLTSLTGIARYEGQRAADDEHMRAMRRMQRHHTAQVVRGFLSQVENAEQRYRDGIPTMSVSGATVAKIVDVLHAHGWTSRITPDDFIES